MTFGPELKFVKAPTAEQGQNLPPSAGLQFFGLVDIDGATEQMTVRLMDRDDNELYKVTLDPVQGGVGSHNAGAPLSPPPLRGEGKGEGQRRR